MTCEDTGYSVRPLECNGLEFIDDGDDDICQTVMND
jgi:hypothetical protein